MLRKITTAYLKLSRNSGVKTDDTYKKSCMIAVRLLKQVHREYTYTVLQLLQPIGARNNTAEAPLTHYYYTNLLSH
jgi:hypothetical protein